MTTLVISALAAVLTAIIVSLFWERGTLIATAITPVIVALVGEGLARPAGRLEEAASSVVAKTPLTGVRHKDSDTVPADGTSETETRGAAPDREQKKPPDGGHSRRRILIALVTGLLAFAIAAVVLTGTELATGGSLNTNGRTTLFGGSEKPSNKDNGNSQPGRGPESTDQEGGMDQPDGTDEHPATPGEEHSETVPPEEPDQETPGDTGETPAPSGSGTTS